MRVTLPDGQDVEIRPGLPARVLRAHCGVDQLWSGPTRLDDDHPSGLAPLVEGALLSTSAGPWSTPIPGRAVEVVSGPDAGWAVLVTSAGVLVGRDAACDLTLDDPALSRMHAIIAAGDPPRVRDLGSTNGVRGMRSGTVTAHGQLQIGNSVLSLTPDELVPDPPPAATRSTVMMGAAATGVSALVVAVATGRWLIAAVAIVPAAIALWRWWHDRRRRDGLAVAQWPTSPVAITGQDRWIRGYARALALHRGTSPAGKEWTEPWHRWLPTRNGIQLVALPVTSDIPSWCASHVEAGPEGVIVHEGGVSSSGPPLCMSATAAEAAARRLAAGRAPRLPDMVHWADLPAVPRANPWSVTLGIGDDGPVVLDLDTHGPHLLVAGTTGSGKSLLLETLVTALAVTHAPARLQVALIDFKGGAGLRRCMDLPHVVGTLTDLDGTEARRALAALSAAMLERKEALARANLTSFQEWERSGGAPPRLLVVVDEYQEIVVQHPGFVPELTRIATQGRALGLHLVMATQRPAGAVTPQVRANVGATIALRVASAAESRDVLGVADAVDLSCAGRAILATPAGRQQFQVAAPRADPMPPIRPADGPSGAGTALARAVAERWSQAAAPPPLWAPPLPERWGPADSDDPAMVNQVVIALADDLDSHHLVPVAWRPQTGPAVIVGPSGSGRTQALASLAAQAALVGLRPVRLPTDPREAARVLALAEHQTDWLLLIDDADLAVTLLAEVDDGTAVEAVMSRRARGLPTALAGSAATPARLASGAGVRAVLAGLDATDATGWGVPRDLHLAERQPGRAALYCDGQWRLAQLATAQPVDYPRPVTSLWVDTGGAAWAIAGDDARPIESPDGTVAVIGPPGAGRDAWVGSMGNATVHCYDMASLAPPGADAYILTEPRTRDVRLLARADWRGVVDPVPIPGRGVLIRNGRAQPIQRSAGPVTPPRR